MKCLAFGADESRVHRMPRFVLFGCGLLIVACSSGGTDTHPAEKVDGGGGAGGAPVSETLKFRTTTMDACGQAGYQSIVATGGGRTAVITLATTSETQSCKTMTSTVDINSYSICLAQWTGGSTGTPMAETITTQGYLALMGAGVAVNKQGKVAVAYTGGEKGTLRCGASDLVVGEGSTLQSAKPVVKDSASAGLAKGQEGNCVQQVCNTGDATGYWPTIAFDRQDQLAVAFRDLHFGFAADDLESSDVEFARGPAYATTTIDVSRGGGDYSRIGFDQDNRAAVVHYNGSKADVAGIWFHRESAEGWSAKRIAAVKIGEQLGFGVSPSGTFSVAYYDEARARLVYMESKDGKDWVSNDVDKDGITGQYPSLTIDADGQPAIAYYRCADYNAVERTCSQAKDGLYLARRDVDGRWRTQKVFGEAGKFDGLYPALAFADGKLMIAFQSKSFDPKTNESTVRLVIALQE